MSLFLKQLCLLQQGYEEKSWENFDIAKQNKWRKQTTSQHNTKSTQTKDSFNITFYKFHAQP